jgi:5-formyltetrahydrofolate cyclo-ligase
MKLTTKKEIRQAYEGCKAFTKNADKLLIANIIHLIENILYANLGIYYPMKNEIDITPISKKLNHLSLPKMINNELFFTRFQPFDTILLKNSFGFLETNNSDIITPDLLVIPGLAFNIKGGRIGRGFGHYDKYLNKNVAKTIGICFENQLYEDFEQESHDIQMNYIVTEKRIILCTT